MKKLTHFLIFLLSINGIIAAPLKSHVDECSELASIVFNLAGSEEYSMCEVPSYAKAIDSTFAPYTEHKLISFIKEIDVPFGAVAAGACLEIKNGKVVIKPGVDISRIGEMNKHWTPEAFKKFILYLNKFYSDSKFKDFYVKHTDLYRMAEKRLDELLTPIDLSWFEGIFGEKLEDPIIIVSLANGPINNAFNVPYNRIKKFGIVVGCGSDNKGMPAYGRGFASIVIHEFLHKYSNPRIEEYWTRIDSSAQKIYSYVKEDMNKIRYGDAKTTIIEWFDNLLVNVYLNEHLEIRRAMNLPVRYFIAMDQNKGFIWMDRSVNFMQYFLANRDQYPQIDDFMPQIADFINYTANHFDQVLDEFKHRKPYVVDAFPLPGSTMAADVDTVIIRFSEPMEPFFGFRYVKDKSISLLPMPKKPEWQDEYTLIIPVGKLEKGKTYGVTLNSSFSSKKTYGLSDGFEYTFKTAK